MPNRQTIARKNRNYLLKPSNLILIGITIVLMAGFQYTGYTKFAMGYYLSTSLAVAQVLLATKKRVKLSPTSILLIDPLIFTAIMFGIYYILD